MPPRLKNELREAQDAQQRRANNQALDAILLESDGSEEPEALDDDEEETAPSADESGDQEWEMDAIKWAIWKDSTHERDDGWLGWHYGVMWKNYLKTGTDTVEPLDVFGEADDPEDDIVRQYWKSLNTKDFPFLRLRGGRREPKKPEKPGHRVYFHTPPEQMKEWYKDSNGKRELETYIARRRWIKHHPGEIVPKRLSDYYVYKKRLAREAAVRIAERQATEERGITEPSQTRKKKEKRTGDKESKKRKRTDGRAEDVNPSSTDQPRQFQQGEAGPSTYAAPNTLATSVSEPKAKRKNKNASPLFMDDGSDSEDVKPSRSPVPRPAPEVAESPVIVKPTARRNRVASSPSSEEEEQEEVEVDMAIDAVDDTIEEDPPPEAQAPTSDVPSIPLVLPDTIPLPTQPPDVLKAPTPPPSPPSFPPAATSAPTDPPDQPPAPPSQPAPEQTVDMPLAPQPPMEKEPTPVPIPVPSWLASALVPPQQKAPRRLDLMGKISKRQDGTGGISPISEHTSGNASPRTAIDQDAPIVTTTPAVQPASKISPAPAISNGSSIVQNDTYALAAEQEGEGTTRPTKTAQVVTAAESTASSPMDIVTSPNGSTGQISPQKAASALPAQTAQGPNGIAPAVTALPAPLATQPVRPADPASRPKYQQPKKIKVMDDVPSKSIIRKPIVISRPTGSAAVAPLPPPFALTGPAGPGGPTVHPLSPLSAGGRSPLVPSVPAVPNKISRAPPVALPLYAHGASLPDQNQAYRHNRPPPSGPRANGQQRIVSPVISQGGHALPLVPVAPVPTGPRAVRPLVLPQTTPTSPPHSATAIPFAALYDASKDPRRAAAAVTQPMPDSATLVEAALPVVSTPAVRYDAAKDPRRKQPVSTTEPTPIAAQPAPVVITTRSHLADVRLHIPLRNIRGDLLDVKLTEGSRIGRASHLAHSMQPRGASLMDVRLEEIDDAAIVGTIKCGATVAEWAKVDVVELGRESAKHDWNIIEENVKDGMAYVSYFELPTNPVTLCALALTHPQVIDFDTVGMGTWKLDEINVAAVLLFLPRDPPGLPPLLPNPLRPFQPVEPHSPIPKNVESMSLLDSLGIDDRFYGKLRQGTVSKYPPAQGPNDLLDPSFVGKLKASHISPPQAGRMPDTGVILNMRLGATLRSESVKGWIQGGTAIYAVGPSVNLYPASWRLQRIWQEGGLVTFAPNLVLRDPAKFKQVVQLINNTESWAAYVVPSVIDYFEKYKDDPSLSTDALALEFALSMTLLDRPLYAIAGRDSIEGGGLVVSCAPPNIHRRDDCMRWLDLLRQLNSAEDYETLASLCKVPDVAVDNGLPLSQKVLMRVQKAQLEDLVRMRMNPHQVPYRRFIYVGEASPELEAQYGHSVDFVHPDDIASIVAGRMWK